MKRYFSATLVVAVIVGLLVLYVVKQRRADPLPDWPKGATHDQSVPDTTQTAQRTPTVSPQTNQTAQTGDEEDLSRQALFDPDDVRTAAKYRLPVKLSTLEVKRFTADVACAEEYFDTWYNLAFGYAKLAETLADKQDAIFDRVSSGKGFKHEKLPLLWRQVMDIGGIDPVQLMGIQIQQNLSIIRFKGIKFRLLGGEVTTGDTFYINWLASNSLRELPLLGKMLTAANDVGVMMVDEGLLGGVPENVIAKHPDLQKYVDEIYTKYHGTDGTPPKLDKEP